MGLHVDTTAHCSSVFISDKLPKQFMFCVLRLRNIRYVFNTVILVILWRLLIANSNLARNSWFFVMGLVFKFVRFFRLTSTLSRS